ncbi:MAG TPA: cation:proton antiporter [Dehalococcoidia bacterium]|nr:cation:proton antiporter [Dehalococcoidia bacterium]
MIHSDLIVTLVFAFVAAFAGGMIAVRLGLPPILGYVLAGVVIGPYTPGGHADATLATQLAEVGVILLMFGVGLHFSLQELFDVSNIAVPGAVVQSAAATLLAFAVSETWGWSLTEGLIFGLSLSVASTIVLLQALEDRNLLDSHPGHVAVGWLIVEDLFTVVILVLLPVFSGSGADGTGLLAGLAGSSEILRVVLSLAQAILFVVLMLAFGRRIIPIALTEVVRSGSRELFTLAILAIALGVAFGSAELFGASLALGAFLAGIVLNESELSHRAGLEALPLRDAFAVLFFVSVGMLFDPSVLVNDPVHVIATVLIIVVGKSVVAFLITAGMGVGVRTSLTVSAALAQVGEFSFILADLGITLHVLPAEANNLILAGAIFSITLNPFFFRNIRALEGWMARSPSFVRFADRRYVEAVEGPSLRRHTIICGFGTGGASLAGILEGRKLPFVVVEYDRFAVERARIAGYDAVFGDCTRPEVLEQAGITEARICVLTFSTLGSVLIASQTARTLNPRIDIAARGPAGGSRRVLREAGVSEVVEPEFEASLELVRHVLHRFGIDAREIAALQAQRRSEHYRDHDSSNL